MTAIVRIRGWRAGILVVSTIQTIRRLSGASLTDAKVMTERVLEGEIVDVPVRDA